MKLHRYGRCESPDPFKKTEDEFWRLKGLLSADRITQDQFLTALNDLKVKHEGCYWMLGTRSGK